MKYLFSGVVASSSGILASIQACCAAGLQAAAALWSLAINSDVRMRITEAGGVPGASCACGALGVVLARGTQFTVGFMGIGRLHFSLPAERGKEPLVTCVWIVCTSAPGLGRLHRDGCTSATAVAAQR